MTPRMVPVSRIQEFLEAVDRYLESHDENPLVQIRYLLRLKIILNTLIQENKQSIAVRTINNKLVRQPSESNGILTHEDYNNFATIAANLGYGSIKFEVKDNMLLLLDTRNRDSAIASNVVDMLQPT